MSNEEEFLTLIVQSALFAFIRWAKARGKDSLYLVQFFIGFDVFELNLEEVVEIVKDF